VPSRSWCRNASNTPGCDDGSALAHRARRAPGGARAVPSRSWCRSHRIRRAVPRCDDSPALAHRARRAPGGARAVPSRSWCRNASNTPGCADGSALAHRARRAPGGARAVPSRSWCRSCRRRRAGVGCRGRAPCAALVSAFGSDSGRTLRAAAAGCVAGRCLEVCRAALGCRQDEFRPGATPRPSAGPCLPAGRGEGGPSPRLFFWVNRAPALGPSPARPMAGPDRAFRPPGRPSASPGSPWGVGRSALPPRLRALRALRGTRAGGAARPRRPRGRPGGPRPVSVAARLAVGRPLRPLRARGPGRVPARPGRGMGPSLARPSGSAPLIPGRAARAYGARRDGRFFFSLGVLSVSF